MQHAVACHERARSLLARVAEAPRAVDERRCGGIIGQPGDQHEDVLTARAGELSSADAGEVDIHTEVAARHYELIVGIIPAAFASTYPALGMLNIMRLATPQSAILSAVIFNALIIILLIPLALRGVRYVAAGAEKVLRRNLLIYGLGGLIAPFPGIKLIDLLLVALRLS